jgi:ATP-grasp domain, R2K clade family 3
MFWRLHKAIFDTRIEEAKAIIESFGDTVQIVEGTVSKIAPVSVDKLSEPSMAITTLQDARQLLTKDYPSTPWLFYHTSKYDVSYWASRFPQDIPWLNRHGVFIPYGNLSTHPIIKNLAGEDNRVFIRPNSGNKVFTGFDIAVDDTFSEELKKHMLFVRPEEETLCYVTPYKKIRDIEWRFWICEHEVVAYTPYSWGEDPELFKAPDSILELAEKVAKSNFNPDYAYVADFVLDSTGNPYLVEINAASTSGIYSVDLNKLLSGLRKTSIREYDMEIDY